MDQSQTNISSQQIDQNIHICDLVIYLVNTHLSYFVFLKKRKKKNDTTMKLKLNAL